MAHVVHVLLCVCVFFMCVDVLHRQCFHCFFRPFVPTVQTGSCSAVGSQRCFIVVSLVSTRVVCWLALPILVALLFVSDVLLLQVLKFSSIVGAFSVTVPSCRVRCFVGEVALFILSANQVHVQSHLVSQFEKCVNSVVLALFDVLRVVGECGAGL